MTGVLLTLIRLQEPFFMYQVKKRFYSFFGMIIKDNKEYQKDVYKNTLNHYLTKSLNLELVNVILQSIVSFTRQSLKQEQRLTAIKKKQGDKYKQNSSLVAQQQFLEDRSPFDIIASTKIPRIIINNAE